MTHCTCDRETTPREEPCPIHEEEDPIRVRIAEAREALENAKTPRSNRG